MTSPTTALAPCLPSTIETPAHLEAAPTLLPCLPSTVETPSQLEAAPVLRQLKVSSDRFPFVESGARPFEMCPYDWENGWRPGEAVRVCEWDERTQAFTGNECQKLITYVSGEGEMGIPSESCVLGLRALSESDEIAALHQQVTQLHVECEELSRVRTEEEVKRMMQLKSMEIREGHFDLVLQSQFLLPLAYAMARLFETSAAENFLMSEMRTTFQLPERWYDLILKPRDTKSPEHLAIERLARIKELEALLSPLFVRILDEVMGVHDQLPPLDKVVLCSRANWSECIPMMRVYGDDDWLWVVCSDEPGHDAGDYWTGESPTHYCVMPTCWK